MVLQFGGTNPFLQMPLPTASSQFPLVDQVLVSFPVTFIIIILQYLHRTFLWFPRALLSLAVDTFFLLTLFFLIWSAILLATSSDFTSISKILTRWR